MFQYHLSCIYPVLESFLIMVERDIDYYVRFLMEMHSVDAPMGCMKGEQHHYPITRKDESLRNPHWRLIRNLYNYAFLSYHKIMKQSYNKH